MYWDLTVIDKQFYLYLSFQKVTVPLLSKMNLENKLVDYINNSGDFFKLDEANDWIVDLRSTELVLAELDIKMKQITEANTELLTLLCDDECYEINLANIDYVLINQYGVVTDKAHYLQTIESLSDSALNKYVGTDTNINLLMQELLNSEIEHFDDNEETVIKILNNTAIEVEHKQAYIAKFATVVDNLSSVTDKEIWDSLLTNQKLTYSAKNIIYYFFNYLDDEGEAIEEKDREFTPVLVEFVNSQNTSFKDESVSGLLEKNQASTIFRKVVQSKIINNERYSALLSWLNIYFTNFDLIDIDDDKMSILIQQDVVKLEKQRQKIEEKSVIQSLKFLRDHYPKHMIAFVVKNIDQYIERLEAQPEEFDHNELLDLLNTEITDEQKLALLPLAKDSISLQSLKVSDDLKAYILEHNFDMNDLSYIGSIHCYEQSNDSNKKTISRLILDNIDSLGQLDDFSYELLQVLLAEESLTIENKYKLITKVLEQLDSKHACKCFEIIEHTVAEDSPYNYQFSSLFKRKRPTIPKNSITEPIVDIFINKGWASKSDDEESVDSFKLNGRNLV